METIAFEYPKYHTDTVSPLNHQDESYSSLEDIVTIDSQIELKVRGELPEIKVLNAAATFMEQKMECYLKHAFEEFKSGQRSILDGTINFDSERKDGSAFEELRKFHLQKFTELADLKTQTPSEKQISFFNTARIRNYSSTVRQ